MATFGPVKFSLTKSGEPIVLRHCDAADAILFPSLQKQIAAETQFTNQIPGRVFKAEDLAAKWEKCKTSKKDLTLGAFAKDLLVGQLVCKVHEETHPWTSHVAAFGMMIRQSYSGQGLGSKMLECLIEHAQKHGITRIEGTIRTQNATALALYKKFGFTIEGTRKNAAHLNNDYQDEYYISKLL